MRNNETKANIIEISSLIIVILIIIIIVVVVIIVIIVIVIHIIVIIILKAFPAKLYNYTNSLYCQNTVQKNITLK